MKRKFANPIQHTVYKTGWKDCLHELGELLDTLPRVEDNESSRVSVYLDELEAALSGLVPE